MTAGVARTPGWCESIVSKSLRAVSSPSLFHTSLGKHSIHGDKRLERWPHKPATRVRQICMEQIKAPFRAAATATKHLEDAFHSLTAHQFLLMQEEIQIYLT